MSTDADRTLHAWLNPKWCPHQREDGTSAWEKKGPLRPARYDRVQAWGCSACGKVLNTYSDRVYLPREPDPPQIPSYADWRLLLAEDGPVAKLTPEQRAALAYRFTQINPAASTYRAFTELLGCMVRQDAPAAFRDELAALVKELGKGT